MISKINSAANIEAMLHTLRAHQAQASGGAAGAHAPSASGPEAVGFGQSVQRVLQQVNSLQTESKQLTQRYQRGEDIPLTDVVLASQKSSLAFEATLQVRNRVLKAYEDILNMPV